MRAVYYCRVSTDEEVQINALERQVQEAEACIKLMGWKQAGGYIDEGKSGTSSKARNEYKSLFNDLSSDKFDIIVIKSQDRLMRNTREWYIFIDALASNGKKLFFYLENKFYTPEDALLTGIKAILAEEYSRELSKKIRNAHKNRQERGGTVIITSATWGYDKIGKDIVVNEHEAGIVRLIFDLCIQGYGSRLISKELSGRGIKSRTGGYFPEITVRRIIRNPLFKGTAVMNKRTSEFGTKRVTQNDESEWRIHHNAVPAIVSAEVWEAANKKMDSRCRTVNNDEGNCRAQGKNSGKYWFSGKIICGYCGSVYWRKYRRGYKSKDEATVYFMCSEYIKRGRYKNEDNGVFVGCDNPHIKESALISALSRLAEAFDLNGNQAATDKVMYIIKEALSGKNIEMQKERNNKETEKIFHHKDALIDKLLDGTITAEDYKRKAAALEQRLAEISGWEREFNKTEELQDINERISEIKSAIDKINVSELQALRIIKRIEKIVVFQNYMEIYLDFCEGIKLIKA